MDLSQQLAAITLYKDQWLWVLNKPSGLLSVNAKNATKLNLLSQLRLVHKQTSVVHRLDEPTSGVIVYALDKSVEAALQAQFRQQRVRKRYLAVVSGQMCATQGTIRLPLHHDWPRRPRQKICYSSGKPSCTRWQLIRQDKHSTRLWLYPQTGRTHQLRLHLATIGHAIIGDPLYAPVKHPLHRYCQRLLLHAEQLIFKHPISQVDYCFQATCDF